MKLWTPEKAVECIEMINGALTFRASIAPLVRWMSTQQKHRWSILLISLLGAGGVGGEPWLSGWRGVVGLEQKYIMAAVTFQCKLGQTTPEVFEYKLVSTK